MSFVSLPPGSSSGHRAATTSTHPPPSAPTAVIIDDLDFETSALVAKLALEDLEEVFGRRKGKSRADAPLSDEDYAYQLQSEHFKEWLTIAEDAKIAKSLREAVTADAAYLEAFITAEEAATEDRRAAEMLSRGESLPPPKACQARLEDPAFVMDPDPPALSFLNNVSATTLVADDDDVDDGDFSDQETVLGDFDRNQAEIVNDAMIRKSFNKLTVTAGPSINRNKTVHCTICDDSLPYSAALHTPCDHYYCRDCVQELVELFTRDESLFPLRCCQQPIPIANVFPFIALALRRIFETKHAEFSILSKDRIYCVNPICSSFLGSSEGRAHPFEVLCPDCGNSTCPRCKQAAHIGDDCVVNAATIELRALAQREGWQTCPGCHTLVELNLGCYHMTCRCRAQFCYLCAVPWKNCQCPQWEENRLIATAQQQVANELGARAVRIAAPAVLERRVQQRVETLRTNHDCERHNWRYRPGGGQCEECYKNLPSYLLICRGCSLLACVRCSRNRF